MRLIDFWTKGCLAALEKLGMNREQYLQLEMQHPNASNEDFRSIFKRQLDQQATHTDPRLAMRPEQGAGMAAAAPAKPPENFAFSRQQAASWGPQEFWQKMKFAPPSLSAPMAGNVAAPGSTTGVGRIGARRR